MLNTVGSVQDNGDDSTDEAPVVNKQAAPRKADACLQLKRLGAVKCLSKLVNVPAKSVFVEHVPRKLCLDIDEPDTGKSKSCVCSIVVENVINLISRLF